MHLLSIVKNYIIPMNMNRIKEYIYTVERIYKKKIDTNSNIHKKKGAKLDNH